MDTLGDNFSMLTGNLIALFYSPIITVCVSLWRPQNFDWKLLRERTEKMLIEDDIAEADRVSHSVLLGMHDADIVPIAHHAQAGAAGPAAPATADTDTEEALTKVLRFSYWFGGGLSIVLIILWPLLALPQVRRHRCVAFPRRAAPPGSNPLNWPAAGQVNFSKSYWGWWVAIAFIWGHCAAAMTIVLPLWQARHLFLIALGIQPAPEPPRPAEKVTAPVPSNVGVSAEHDATPILYSSNFDSGRAGLAGAGDRHGDQGAGSNGL